ncbi:anhydro-N-acetylmuramic acid kinase [Thermotoga profunda]|uniref:anhydro-N-acetylmuramic acid kinase n=1 Tax=Thermotoga profunda TaxID=1508420 RepID=UPI000597D1CD|nr:anhydro-N-acetylmuramic acid kinase [Thermotoga profunda]
MYWNNFLELINKKERTIMGLMSGTSADGLDIAIVSFSGAERRTNFRLIDFKSLDYPEEFKQRIIKTYDPSISSVKDVTLMNFEIARMHAKMIKQLGIKVDAIGYHGQTVYHMPQERATLQIGEADVLAVELGVPVIHSFRTKDVALGGEGAPITSYFDWVFFRKPHTIVLNIGGIANVTYINDTILAFDTGPGNCLIDLYVKENFNLQYDKNGNLASNGKIDRRILEELIEKDKDYLNKKPPKTTGREWYNKEFLRGLPVRDYNALRTLTYFTAFCIHENMRRYLPKVERIYVFGGGAFNKVILEDLRSFGYKVLVPTKTLAKAREAISMALLANDFLNGVPTNIPSVTGAQRAAILGKVALPW